MVESEGKTVEEAEYLGTYPLHPRALDEGTPGKSEERPRVREGSHVPPVDVRDWSLPIGSERQLFVDDFMIHSMENLKRTLHQPEKHGGNPVLKPEYPWEGTACMANGTILRDPESGELRMYYKGWGGELQRIQQERGERATAVRSPTCLAVSEDGIHWTRPKLGVVEYMGSRENNIVIPDRLSGDLSSFIYDPRDSNPNRRWKAGVFQYGPPHFDGPAGMYAYFSPDGIHWAQHRRRIMAGIGDVSTVVYDPKLGRFLGHVRIIDRSGGRRYRARARCESGDFLHWSRPVATLIPDELDPPDLQFYGMTGWPYESMWLGTLRCYHSLTSTCVDFQLISSRDGIHWERAANREVFLPNGPPGSCDYGYHTDFSNPPLRMGDELWFYYGSTIAGKNWQPLTGGICLAKLRVDGFVSVDAGEDEGTLLTRPLDFEGNHLVVNARAEGGCLQVEVLEFVDGGKPKAIEGFSREDCVAMTEDSIDHGITWRQPRDLSALRGKPIQLRFCLKNVELYSFAIC